MDLSQSPLFSMLTRRLQWLGQRQQVLAQNIANSDTPGFKPRDVEPLDFQRLAESEARRLVASATNPRHISRRRGSLEIRAGEQKGAFETAPGGNAVVVEEQLMKVAETVMSYQLITNLYRKHVNMIKTALGRSGG